MASSIETEETTPNPLDNIMEKVKAAESPSGYAKVELSTKGYFGAPALFHIRNFSTDELLVLGQSDEDDYVEHLVDALQAIIYEKDVDVKKFHEKEVIETLIFLYRTFYTRIMPSMPYELDDSDYDYLAEVYKGKDTANYKERVRALENGQENPVFDLNLDAIKYKEPKKKNTAFITKPDGFSCKFGYPKFGDVLLLKKFTEVAFKDEDKKYATIRNIWKLRKKAEDAAFKGENVALQNIGDITPGDKKLLKEYEQRRSLFLVRGATAQYLKEYKGEDVSGLDLDKKMAIVANDPDFDFITFKKFTESFKKDIEPGPVEKIRIFSPIQQRTVDKDYTFQLIPILKAITSGDSDTTSIEFV